MADISAIFGILLTLGIVFPGMLTAWWLLFPKAVERARVRLADTPGQSFWLGLVIALILGIFITIMLLVPFVPAKVIGWVTFVSGLAVSGLGASGIAAQMGLRLTQQSNGLSPYGSFVRAALVLELAVFFPVIGWGIFLPVAVIISMGATAFSLLRWQPRTKKVMSQPMPPQSKKPAK
jgi:hypothetical protein